MTEEKELHYFRAKGTLDEVKALVGKHAENMQKDVLLRLVGIPSMEEALQITSMIKELNPHVSVYHMHRGDVLPPGQVEALIIYSI